MASVAASVWQWLQIKDGVFLRFITGQSSYKEFVVVVASFAMAQNFLTWIVHKLYGAENAEEIIRMASGYEDSISKIMSVMMFAMLVWYQWRLRKMLKRAKELIEKEEKMQSHRDNMEVLDREHSNCQHCLVQICLL